MGAEPPHDASDAGDPENRRPDLLALADEPRTLARLDEGLRLQGLVLDVVCSLDELRDAYFRCGGADVVLLGPDLPPALANEAIRSLQDLDRTLDVVAFGATLARRVPTSHNVHRIGFHPGSRAAAGAVLKIVRGQAAPET